MQGCTYVFQSWHEVIKEKRSNQEKKVENIEKMMNMGLRLSKLTKMANSCLSPFLLNDMFIFLVSIVCWGYMSSIFLFNLHVLELSPLPLLNTLLFLSVTLENLWQIWCLCDSTQRFLNARELALKELQKDIMDNYPLLDKRLKWKAQIVEERLSNEDAFSPHDFFNLGRSAFLPTIASGFTYYIIIVQFKLSEVFINANNGTIDANNTSNISSQQI